MPRWIAMLAVLVLSAGCGTTRWTDTSRTATEQLLLSSAVDTAINNIDFSPLAGKDVFFDASYLSGITDEKYVVSSLRQHMLAYGCSLKETKEEAAYIVEARAGVVGTNRHDLMLGVPAITLPTTVPGVPSTIPEIPFAKSTDQKGVAKIAVFARERETGVAVWQSGAFPVIASAQDSWLLGAGPFQRGTIYDGTRFAGSRLLFSHETADQDLIKPKIPVTAEAVFEERPVLVRQPAADLSTTQTPDAGVVQAQAQAAAVSGGALASGSGGALAPSSTGALAPGSAGAQTQAAPDDVAPAVADAPATRPQSVPAAPAEMPDEVLSGRIVRLPPVDQRERPDLYAELEADLAGQAYVDDRPPPDERPPAPAATAAELPPQVAFSLFRPSTWFRSRARR